MPPRAWSNPLPKVIMTGPLPPAMRGMTAVIDNLAQSSLGQRVRLALFNTAKTTPENRGLGVAI
ncbi:MAG: hypothetical protein ACFCBW_21390 [Candidatus Competibacterales bacterium]